MGKAKVIENEGKGLYLVQLDLGSVRRQHRMDLLSVEIDALLAARGDLIADVASKRAVFESAQAAYDAAVAIYVESARESETEEELEEAAKLLEEPTRAVIESGDEFREAEAALQNNETETRNIERKRARLEATPGFRLVEAWCADYTTYLDPEDDVATLEVPNEPQAVLVAPGGVTAQDSGYLMKTDFMSAAQAFYNAAIIPGWQKTKPTYRFGTLTGITEDLKATILLEPAVSKAQGISVDRAESLDNVVALYMDCGIAGFQIGDEVLVAFWDQLWTNPRLIGFKSNPRPCPGGALCRVTGSGQNRKAYPVDTGTKTAWQTQLNTDFNYGVHGWAGPWGGVSWDMAGQNRYVYHRNVDYWIESLFPDLYHERDGGDDACRAVILGASVYRDTIIVVVETQSNFRNGFGELVVPPADYNRLDILALKPRGIDDDMGTTDRYLVASVPRDTVFYDSTVDMELIDPDDLLLTTPPPAVRDYSLTTPVGVAGCVGFSISPDGMEYVYCNHTGAYHITITEQSSGTLAAAWEVYPSTLVAWEKAEYDGNVRDPAPGFEHFEDHRYTAQVRGSAIVGAKWVDGVPEWVVYHAEGDQSAAVRVDALYESNDPDPGSSVAKETSSSTDTTEIEIRTTGALDMLVGSVSRSFNRVYELPTRGYADEILLTSATRTELAYLYSDSATLDEVENRKSFPRHDVEVPPESGVYVADRYQTASGSTTVTRVVVADESVVAAGTSASSSALYPPRGWDTDSGFPASPPVKHGWFKEGFNYHNFDDAPVEGFGFLFFASGLWQSKTDAYRGFWFRELDPFRMCKFNRYWYRRLYTAAPQTTKSAFIGDAVFLSTPINGQAFNYMTDADAAEVFNTETPAFDYIVTG